jgi:hypothetical protein
MFRKKPIFLECSSPCQELFDYVDFWDPSSGNYLRPFEKQEDLLPLSDGAGYLNYLV